MFINFYRKDTGFVSELPQTEDPRQVAEATHLAPHGVPSNAIPRALSSTRLHELANQDTGYGATYQSGDTLNVPGANGGEISASLFVIEKLPRERIRKIDDKLSKFALKDLLMAFYQY